MRTPDARSHGPSNVWRRGNSEAQGAHDVVFYDTDAEFVGAAGGYLADGIRADEAAIVIATPQHRRLLEERFRDEKLDVDDLAQRGALRFLDARDTLDSFMQDRVPDRTLFLATLGTLLERVLEQDGNRPVRAFGEMVDALCSEGNVRGALALEDLWNDLARDYQFSLLCAYDLCHAGHAVNPHAHEEIRRRHARTLDLNL